MNTPLRRFTPQQARIVELIGDPRNLSYAEIGALMDPKLSAKTVKAYVRTITYAFDSDTHEAHPPRVQILVWVRALEWELKRRPRLSEIIERSAQRDV